MEHDQQSAYARQGLILLVVIVVLVALAWSLPSRRVEPLPELGQYLPATTVFAIRADRASITGDLHPLLRESERFQLWHASVQEYWTNFERSTDFQVESILIAVTEDRGRAWHSVFFSTKTEIPKELPDNLTQYETDAIGIFSTSDTLAFRRIDSHVGALVSIQDTQDYSTPSAEALAILPPQPIALYARRTFLDQIDLSELIGADSTDLEESLGNEDITVGAELATGMIRIFRYNSEAPELFAPSLRLPNDFSLALLGVFPVTRATALAYDPFAQALEVFVSDQASRASFDMNGLKEQMVDVKGLLIAGSEWLMIGEDTELVTDLVSLFIGAESPRRAVSKLPDGTPYREIVRGMPQPTLEIWHDLPLTVWSGASSTATSSEQTRDFRLLYMTERSGYWHLSNSKELLYASLDSGNAPFTENELAKQCTFGLAGNISSIAIDRGAVLAGKTYDLVSVTLKTPENKGISIFCAQ